MLELEDLQVYYGNIRALDGISLRVETGELVALIGSNGAGKSTTLKTISGLIRPSRGSIRYEGNEISRQSTDRIVALGISHCPEGRHIFGRLTVRENLVLGAIQRPAAQVGPAIDAVTEIFPRLRERLGQAGGTLSGGEQQMLAIARALMSEPRLLVLDEPSLGLAPLMVEHIFEVIAGLKEKGLTILLVEQNVTRTLEIADRVYLMRTGSIEASGAPAEVRSQVDIAGVYLGSGPVPGGG